MTTALISNIERASTVDGPGMRTVIFFKGCPLTCRWCHNPETISLWSELMWERKRCLGCGKCTAECPQCLALKDGTIRRQENWCVRNFACVDACPGQALSVNGKTMTVAEIYDIIRKDRKFYDSFLGGVTFSGGEPLMQIEALTELAKQCRDDGIHTALDTTCFSAWETLEQVLPHLNLLLCDLKLFDREKHRRYTGVDPELIRENMMRADARGIPIWIRTPIIPGINDDDENLSACAAFAVKLKQVERYEILPYNPLAEIKYVRQGCDFGLAGMEAPAPERMLELNRLLKTYGLNCNKGMEL